VKVDNSVHFNFVILRGYIQKFLDWLDNELHGYV